MSCSSAIGPTPTRAIGPGPSGGNSLAYLTNSFPLKLEEPCGVSPLHPTRGIAPGSGGGTYSSYQTNTIPLGLGGLSAARRSPFAEDGYSIASWRRHCRTQKQVSRRKCFCELEVALPPHGLGGGTPPAGCFCIRGKHEKWRRRKRVFSLAIFVFSLCPWVQIFVPSVSCGNKFVIPDCVSQNGCRADRPAVGVQGARSPLLR